jgi:hypothetical protein
VWTKARYLGKPVTNFYGLDLTAGQVIDVPSRLAGKVRPPLFEAVEDQEPEPEDAPSERDIAKARADALGLEYRKNIPTVDLVAMIEAAERGDQA